MPLNRPNQGSGGEVRLAECASLFRPTLAWTIGRKFRMVKSTISRSVYVVGAGLSAGLGFPTVAGLLPGLWDRIGAAGLADDLGKVIRFHHPDFNPSLPDTYPNIERLLSEMKRTLSSSTLVDPPQAASPVSIWRIGDKTCCCCWRSGSINFKRMPWMIVPIGLSGSWRRSKPGNPR